MTRENSKDEGVGDIRTGAEVGTSERSSAHDERFNIEPPYTHFKHDNGRICAINLDTGNWHVIKYEGESDIQADIDLYMMKPLCFSVHEAPGVDSPQPQIIHRHKGFNGEGKDRVCTYNADDDQWVWWSKPSPVTNVSYANKCLERHTLINAVPIEDKPEHSQPPHPLDFLSEFFRNSDTFTYKNVRAAYVGILELEDKEVHQVIALLEALMSLNLYYKDGESAAAWLQRSRKYYGVQRQAAEDAPDKPADVPVNRSPSEVTLSFSDALKKFYTLKGVPDVDTCDDKTQHGAHDDCPGVKAHPHTMIGGRADNTKKE